MKRILLLALAIAMTMFSLEGCFWWGWDGPGWRGGGGGRGGHDGGGGRGGGGHGERR